jgi:hypothetical protein
MENKYLITTTSFITIGACPITVPGDLFFQQAGFIIDNLLIINLKSALPSMHENTNLLQGSGTQVMDKLILVLTCNAVNI